MGSKAVLVAVTIIIAIGIILGAIYFQMHRQPAAPEAAPSPAAMQAPEALNPNQQPSGVPSVVVSGAPEAKKMSNPNPDLTVDANGLSKATVVMQTTKGVVKFKFYPKDAPNTVNRMIELINQGFYNGLSFHRVVPGFVVQGGDPQGTGMGGSGKHLKAEFNKRRHVEGALGMARAADPDSADSQFYFTLGTHPHLDRAYTVFAQVIEGMDVVKKIQVGDKMTSVVVE